MILGAVVCKKFRRFAVHTFKDHIKFRLIAWAAEQDQLVSIANFPVIVELLFGASRNMRTVRLVDILHAFTVTHFPLF